MKYKIFAFLLAVSNSSFVHSQTIATCSNPQGYAFHHYHGLVKKEDSGFLKDGINNGTFTFVKLDSGEYDVLLMDAAKRVFSLKQDGGKIFHFRSSSRDVTFIHANLALEVYTLWVDKNGSAFFDLLQSKGGVEAPIHKSSLMVGKCDFINFSAIK